MKADDDPEHLDFVVLAGHKMYAPFGTGALVGPKEVFLQSGPEYTGGGTISIVTLDEVHWAGLPHREESGSRNVVGAVAMAASAKALMEVGMDHIAGHEEALTIYALQRLRAVPGIEIYGESDPARVGARIGAIPFNLNCMPHSLVAAILGYEGGIGVRSGRFCAQPYVTQLLGITQEEAALERKRILSGDRSDMPGMVRISFGCYNSTEDIDRLVEMMERIGRGGFQGDHRAKSSTGEYGPVNYEEPLADYLLLDSHLG